MKLRYAFNFLIPAFILSLAACNNDNTNKDPVTNNDNNANENVNTDNGNVEEENNTEADNNADNVVENENNNNANNNDANENADNNTASDLDGFEEADIVKENIDNLDDLKVIVETDNPNKRVILYKEDNKPQYKSIFVKDNEHLKIIDIHSNNDLLFDETIN